MRLIDLANRRILIGTIIIISSSLVLMYFLNAFAEPPGEEEDVTVQLDVTVGGSSYTAGPSTTNCTGTVVAEAAVGASISVDGQYSFDSDDYVNSGDGPTPDDLTYGWSKGIWTGETPAQSYTILESDAGTTITVSLTVNDVHTAEGTVDDTNSPTASQEVDVPKVTISATGVSNNDNPGLYINVNWDDDDIIKDGWGVPPYAGYNETPPNAVYIGDKHDTIISGGDNDFRTFTVSVAPEGLTGKVKLTFPNNIKVWKTNTKRDDGVSSIVTSGTEFDPDDIPDPLYIEGFSGTDNFRVKELKAEYIKGGNVLDTDILKITVFEVTLTGLFGFDGQQADCDKKHKTWQASDDNDGKISWDDANGDGTTGDMDTDCDYFRNCMECQGTVNPTGVTTEVTFDSDRQIYGKAWSKKGDGEWRVDYNYDSWEPDNFDGAEDNSPSANNHIYNIDSPGLGVKMITVICDSNANIVNFRNWVTVNIGGTSYQCSDFYKWKSTLYTHPKDDDDMTRDPNEAQVLGAGWQTVPNDP